MKQAVINLGMPNSKPQEKFLTSKKRYTAYGGSRGGGKSWAVDDKAVLGAIKYPGIRMLILRKTIPDLRENHILPLQRILGDAVKYNKDERAFNFPNGSRIKMGYCQTDSDLTQYQGVEYDWLFIDEATQFTEYQYDVIRSCNRGVNSIPKRIYLTCNPGGIGHQWVKRLFIDKQYRETENPDDYCFIPARVYDNKDLMKTNPEYLENLKSLPDGLREAWLDGRWDLFAGQFFTEFDPSVHVVEPFVIPKHWNRYRTIDYGFDMFVCLWIAISPEGKAFVYKEVAEPNLTLSEAAQRLKYVNGSDKVIGTFAPPDLWNRRQDTGRSGAEVFLIHGVPLFRAQNSRENGWAATREWLRPYEEENKETGEISLTAKMKFLPCCENVIKCIPALQHDEKKPNDCAKEPHETTHSPDALRYFCFSRALTPLEKAISKVVDMLRYRQQPPRTYRRVLGGKTPRF